MPLGWTSRPGCLKLHFVPGEFWRQLADNELAAVAKVALQQTHR
jgi:hypothetical protein